MKKVIISFALWISLAGSAGLLQAQVTIGQNIPPSKFSLLDLNTSVEKKALHLPRLTIAERDALVSSTSSAGDKTLARGLKIFNTDINCVEWWNGAKWISNCYTIEEQKCLVSGLDCPACELPTASSPQDFPAGAIVSMLRASGEADAIFFWYYSPTATSPLDPNTPLEDGHTYYVTQLLNKPGGCSESPIDDSAKALVNLYASACVGNILFEETFDSFGDGLNPASANYSPEGLPAGMSDYNFSSGSWGVYHLLKRPNWVNTHDDHTYPNDPTRGRCFDADGATEANRMVFRQEVPDVCENTTLVFSYWAAGNGNGCQLRFRVHEGGNPDMFTFLAESTPPELTGTTWIYHEFSFDVPPGVTSIWYDVTDLSTVRSMNDFDIDDIQVKLCLPAVLVASTSKTVSKGEMLNLSGYMTDASQMGAIQTLTSRWEYSATGTSGWQEVPNSAVGSTISGSYISNTLTKYYAVSGDTGYYRMAVGTLSTIDTENCKAKSPVIKVTVR